MLHIKTATRTPTSSGALHGLVCTAEGGRIRPHQRRTVGVGSLPESDTRTESPAQKQTNNFRVPKN